MPTANEEYRDAVLRHQIGLRRYSSGLAKRVADLLARADADLVDLLNARLPRFLDREIDFTGERWAVLLQDIRAARSVAIQEYKDLSREELNKLSKMEADREINQLEAAIPIEVSFATVAADQLRAIVSSRPFQGRLLNDWFKTLEAQDGARVIQAIQVGMTEGEPIPSIVKRIVGTKANNYADGILSITRQNATAIVRTAVNHVSNTAREYVWEANEDIVIARIWHSTLDGRTSAICRARDGLGAPVGENVLPPDIGKLQPPSARPPAHINCRSVMVVLIGNGLLGNRPFVVDTRTPGGREVDFQAEARASGRNIKDVRSDWFDENIGQVPAGTTYNEFLRRQSASFQDEVLGKTKGKLFRTGDLNVQQFIDRSGNELTLSELAATKPEVFRAANLNPSGF